MNNIYGCKIKMDEEMYEQEKWMKWMKNKNR
jgi:hypothetical protein